VGAGNKGQMVSVTVSKLKLKPNQLLQVINSPFYTQHLTRIGTRVKLTRLLKKCAKNEKVCFSGGGAGYLP